MTATEPKTKLVKTLRGGQITIPVEFRRELGIEEESMVELTLTEDRELQLRPVTVERGMDSVTFAKELYDLFEPVRRSILESGMTEDEVNQMIDEAVSEVRSTRQRRELPGRTND